VDVEFSAYLLMYPIEVINNKKSKDLMITGFIDELFIRIIQQYKKSHLLPKGRSGFFCQIITEEILTRPAFALRLP